MEEHEKIAKMDLLRSRFNISYARAQEVLEACEWDAVAAVLRLEEETRGNHHGVYEEVRVAGADLVETLKRLLHEGNINRIVVKEPGGTEVLNLPVNGVIALAAIVPILAAVGAAVVLAMDYTVVVERKP